MNTHFARALCALVPLALAQSALAEGAAGEAVAPSGDLIVVTPVSLHPAAGLMNEHTHDGGEFMIGLRYTRSRHSGANLSGTEPIADAEILAAGYTVRAREMTMDMVMLDLMYAPNDKLTLMVMPHWMRHEMTMVGIDPMNAGAGGMDQAHHGLAFGQTMTHSTQGFGDTLVSASYRMANSPTFKAHATLGLWLPTGNIDRRNPDGTFVHYGMQSGGGTWDSEPSATVSGQLGAVGYGVQASYRWRCESRNASGFAFGDRASASGWLSYLVDNGFSLTSRLTWEHEGQILGEYSGPHKNASPSDGQENYGGSRVIAGLGANIALPFGGRDRPQIGVEFGVPLFQDLNGVQLPEDWRASVALTKTF
ncbi:transporter [Erythrobacter mangrovi]|uniref:Transporter n=1 Tax=Erythrobacter mangrovi TaxID=2739433 RepID=A0A7D3XC30_9SPHN|nr:transporter [Erythrobacter mangrovi]QKG72090.1 hypothetical protein HQR01_12335 [Erythrobacter mangrovi]